MVYPGCQRYIGEALWSHLDKHATSEQGATSLMVTAKYTMQNIPWFKKQYGLNLESQRSNSNSKLFLFSHNNFSPLPGYELGFPYPEADDIPMCNKITNLNVSILPENKLRFHVQVISL